MNYSPRPSRAARPCGGITLRSFSLVAVLSLVTATCYLLAPSTAAGGGKEIPSVKSIVDKAIEFHGGAKALGRDVPLIRTEESEILIEGDKLPMTSSWQYQPPDKGAFQVLVKIGGLRLNLHQALVGRTGWAQFGPAQAQDLSPEQVDGIRWEHRNHLRSVKLLTLVERDFDTRPAKATRFADRDAWEIYFALKANSDSWVKVYFDRATAQVLGDESEREVPALTSQGREKKAMFRAVYKSYIDVDGMKMPAAMSIYRDGQLIIEVRKAEMRIVDAIDPKVFEKPRK